MSPVIEQIQKRIVELRAVIDSAKGELAAYEKVLEVELSREKTSIAKPDSDSIKIPEYSGKKIDFIRDVVRAYGRKGATIKDIDDALETLNIERGKNLIYTALEALIKKQGVVRKKGEHYCYTGPAAELAMKPASGDPALAA